MTRRWLLLPLAATLAAPLAWSAAAATFTVSPSVLQTLVVTDLPPLEEPEDPDDPVDPPPLDEILDDGCAAADVRTDVVCLEISLHRYNNGGNFVPGQSDFGDGAERRSVPQGATYALSLAPASATRACPAAPGVDSGPFTHTGSGTGFVADGDTTHRVCATHNVDVDVVVTLVATGSSAGTGSSLSTTSSVTGGTVEPTGTRTSGASTTPHEEEHEASAEPADAEEPHEEHDAADGDEAGAATGEVEDDGVDDEAQEVTP